MTPEEMKALEGTEIGVSSWITVDQHRIDAFAEASGDHQFIHVDPERARAETPFGGTIAHGFLTLSLFSAMAYEVMPRLDGTTMGVNYGLNRIRFLNPVPAGARVRGHFTLLQMEMPDPGHATFTWKVLVEIGGQEKPALIAEWINRRYLEKEA
jgi:acyl dehydratase